LLLVDNVLSQTLDFNDPYLVWNPSYSWRLLFTRNRVKFSCSY